MATLKDIALRAGVSQGTGIPDFKWGQYTECGGRNKRKCDEDCDGAGLPFHIAEA